MFWRRWLIIGTAAVIFAFALLWARRLSLSEDIVALLPDSDPAVRDYRLLATRLGALDALYIDLLRSIREEVRQREQQVLRHHVHDEQEG